MRKISFPFTVPYFSFSIFPSFCRSKFPTYIIFLFSKELLFNISCKVAPLAVDFLHSCLPEGLVCSPCERPPSPSAHAAWLGPPRSRLGLRLHPAEFVSSNEKWWQLPSPLHVEPEAGSENVHLLKVKQDKEQEELLDC